MGLECGRHHAQKRWNWEFEDFEKTVVEIRLLKVQLNFLLSTPQLLRSGRIWHKVNFEAEFNRFEFRVFLLLD